MISKQANLNQDFIQTLLDDLNAFIKKMHRKFDSSMQQITVISWGSKKFRCGRNQIYWQNHSPKKAATKEKKTQ